jgi:hypothetical protein
MNQDPGNKDCASFGLYLCVALSSFPDTTGRPEKRAVGSRQIRIPILNPFRPDLISHLPRARILSISEREATNQ